MSREFTWPAVDAADREKACCDLSTCYLVEAAAGTGKTTLLVARIVQIIETTLTRLPRVVAITFTEKAAGELKFKLKETLEERAAGDGEAAERCRLALQDLDSRPVGTIHAFCRELLAARPVEAGVEPGFSVLDNSTSQGANSDIFEQWLSEELRGECPAAAPLLRWGMPVENAVADASLRSLFLELLRHRDDLDALSVPCRSRQALLDLASELRAEIREAAGLLSACSNPEDKCAREIRTALAWSDELSEKSLPLLFDAARRAPKLKSTLGQKASWNPPDTLLRARAFTAEFSPSVQRLEQAIFSHFAAQLLAWIRSGIRRGEAVRRERAQLDFDDLLICARNMLHGNRAARDYFRRRFDYILVDEFQDTDPLQTEIVFFLSERENRFASSWEEVELDTGKLFIVGDPKQSIYRFRRADLDLYGRVREKIARDGGLLTIRANFRSESALIAEVNALFGERMRGHDTRCEPNYVAMEPYRPAESDGPCVKVL
ncbi:MAG: UvrD-helicase domain-containing protein, partial [bacterium]|nr:UvrD-helicase domain-containing protein [bacterium]